MAELDRAWWPVDKLLAGYLAGGAALVLWFFSRVPGAGWIVSLHLAGILLVVLAIRRPSPAAWVFRHWYPLPYVAACYREMGTLIPAIRRSDVDRELARLDYRFWGVNPTVWLERIANPWATEVLQIAYGLFIPSVLLIAWLLWRKRRYPEFRYYAFLIALGFLVSYVGYLLAPARGPRFLLRGAQTAELQGLWMFRPLQTLLDWLESAHYDAFPSGHVELTMLAWWGSRQISAGASAGYLAYTMVVVFATVYLRYHYTVDVLAGMIAALALILAAPPAYRILGQRGR